MAKKAKGNRVQVILECTEQKESGVAGMSRYITTKNKKNTPERMERKKYNPYLHKVTTFAAKAGSRSMVKCIRMDKSPKTGAYIFTELLVEAGKEKDFFNKK